MMPPHIRDKTTTELVRTLAKRRQIGLTEAVRLAAQNELRRADDAVVLRERIAMIRRTIITRPVIGEQADKAFFDDLSGNL